jgi:hypothetical protein
MISGLLAFFDARKECASLSAIGAACRVLRVLAGDLGSIMLGANSLMLVIVTSDSYCLLQRHHHSPRSNDK